jgi:hypothetical protein
LRKKCSFAYAENGGRFISTFCGRFAGFEVTRDNLRPRGMLSSHGALATADGMMECHAFKRLILSTLRSADLVDPGIPAALIAFHCFIAAVHRSGRPPIARG